MSPSIFRRSILVIALLFLLAHFPSGAAAKPSLSQRGEGIAKGLNSKIRKIVILMEENRSFDQIFGWRPGVNGLNGTEFNLVNTSDPKSQRIYVTHNASNINPCDPDHDWWSTTYKIFGPDAFSKWNFSNPTMSGFAQWESKGQEHCGVMEMFDAKRHFPVLSALADEFVLFDRFFASMPGPTWPNRIFTLAGTSSGLTATGPWYHMEYGKFIPAKTIMDQLEVAGGTWRLYYNDTPWELIIETVAHNPQFVVPVTNFFEDARTGNLPDLSIINPRGGIDLEHGLGSNDQHPDHDIALGEAYYKDVYEALRASPDWNSTLLIITYDEHGGFYDHVKTPLHAPPPGDGEASYPDPHFNFDRIGLRIPTLLVSPWLPKGWVESAPPSSQRPAPNSEYELTSLIATARKLLPVLSNAGPLTKRDAWAATFEHLFDLLDEPRTDCPMHLPMPPPPSMTLEQEANQKTNGRQWHMMQVHAHLAGVDPPHHVQKQRDVTHWLQKHYKIHHDRTMEWKQSKINPKYEVYIAPYIYYVYRNDSLHYQWRVTTMSGPHTGLQPSVAAAPLGPMTISITLPNESQAMCLDNVGRTPNQPLGISKCYPTPDPRTNRDKDQQWVMLPDAAIRPYLDQSLCLTNNVIDDPSDETIFLTPCDRNELRQHYDYHGMAPGEGGEGWIYFGDEVYVIYVRNSTATVPRPRST